jgi:rare lipoprotein A
MQRGIYFVFIVLLSINLGLAQEQVGFASVRPLAHEGMMTQSKVPFSHDSLVAAHRHIPLGKIVRVTNLDNLKSVIVKINDRGPFVLNRIIDLSQIAAKHIGIKNKTVKVRIEVLNDSMQVTEINYGIKSDALKIDSKEDEKYQFYTLQLGSFSSKANAQRFIEELEEEHQIPNLKVITEDKDNTTAYKVIVGQFTTREYAQVYKEKLDEKVEGSLIVPLE